jgi:hypothetical protein
MDMKRLLSAALFLMFVVACSAPHNGPSAVEGAAAAAGAKSAGGAGGSATAAGSGGAPQTQGDPTSITPIEDDAGDASSPPDLLTDVNVIITADNAYGFGYGTSTQLVNYFGGIENTTSSQIFDCPVGVGAEQYTVPAADANVGGFLYIIGYADRKTTQGVLAEFYRDGAAPVFSGTGPWQVCATGLDYDPGSGGPTMDVVNQQILSCNAGTGDPATTSAGWVGATPTPNGNLAVGEDNTTTRVRPTPGNEFLIACGIEPGARWMWYECGRRTEPAIAPSSGRPPRKATRPRIS